MGRLKFLTHAEGINELTMLKAIQIMVCPLGATAKPNTAFTIYLAMKYVAMCKSVHLLYTVYNLQIVLV